jgi:UDP-N-acetylmuramoyl-L-alanyl-D-glutamate--2,6-diaminopimelate ligase
MQLKDLLEKSQLQYQSSMDVSFMTVTGLVYDSRLVKAGDLFFAMKGVHVDGHEYLDEVEKKGVVAAIVERDASSGLPTIKTDALLASMSKISDVFYDHPSRKLPVIGLTGTNGKTTTTYIIEAILRSVGKTCGVLGTVNYRIGSDIRPAPNTTPMSIDVQSFLNEAIQKKLSLVVMEVSSHALELHRVDDIQFAIGVFTNLTQDHLDFHKSMDNYFLAKRKLFSRKEHVKAVINIDDDYGQRLASEFSEAITFGTRDAAKLRATSIVCNLQGLQFKLIFPSKKTFSISNNLLGLHNVSNCLAAAGALVAFGLPEDAIVQGLNQTLAVPGRLERVEMGQKFVVAVDYAHTHDALSQVLSTLRNTGPRRLICIFGAGGDRDRTKRPKMGDVAVRMADEVYVTSDNPRSEDPKKILLDIEEGILKTGKKNYHLIEDREEAIRQALSTATQGDIVLIAGKGHEDYQIIGNKKIHFSDFEVARKLLSK